MIVRKLLQSLLLSNLLLLVSCGITEPVKRDIVTNQNYQVCVIPDTDFVTIPIPTRDWDWSTKTDDDALKYIDDLRDAIKQLNIQVGDAGKVYDNCKQQANQMNNNKGTTNGN